MTYYHAIKIASLLDSVKVLIHSLGCPLPRGHCSGERQWLSTLHKVLMPNQSRILAMFTPWGASEFAGAYLRSVGEGLLPGSV